ncbi:unnamed protein product, partial [Discosporangium mesarthrocarpum]
AQFYGPGARPRFYDLYRLAHRQAVTVDDQNFLQAGEKTPRQQFLRGIIQQGLPPMPVMVMKSKNPRELNLGKELPTLRLLGDKVGISLAVALPGIPQLESLNIRDNRLTDLSLVQIMASTIQMDRLTSLDVSCNKIDSSAHALREYVASRTCSLKSLSLSKADIDDGECTELMEAISTNFSIESLDLSHNMIGEQETHNFVNPDFKTGGEAIAEMLESNITLTRLDLSWNSVRMNSAITLGKALAYNTQLLELNLSNNSLACRGVQAIAHSLRFNNSIETLDLSFNNMTPRAAMVMANALLDNKSLTRLNMNHNNIGKSGARAMFMALRRRTSIVGVGLLVGMESCEPGTEVAGLFDMYSPTGRQGNKAESKWGNPYDYMVARMLIEIANRRLGCELLQAELLPKGELGFYRAAPAINGRSTASGDRANGWKLGRSTLLGASESGNWRPVANSIIEKSFGEGTRPVLREDLQAFLTELGLEPTAEFLERLCEMFNERRKSEREKSRAVASGSRTVLSSVQGLDFTSDNGSITSNEQGLSSGGRSVASGTLRTSSISSHGVSSKSIPPAKGSSCSSLAHPHGEVRSSMEFAKYTFELMFDAADTDGSGCINTSEFSTLLQQLGRDIRPDVAKHCLARYDIDRSGTVETGEFIDFLMHEFVAPGLPSQGALCAVGETTKWEVPRDGRLRCTVVADHAAPCLIEVATEDAVEAVISNIRFSAKTEQDKLEMFQLATEGTDFYMTSLVAQRVIDEWSNGLNIVDILEVLVPQMASSRNVVSLLENNLSYKEKLQLRSRLGQAWGPLVGNPTGTYCLDMADKRHRAGAKAIAMVNHSERERSISGAAGRHDTSQ